MKRAKCLCGLFVITIWIGVSFASDVDYGSLPELKEPDRKESGVIYRLLEKSHQTILGFTLIKNSLSDVEKKFRETQKVPIKGFTHGTSVCISAAQANDLTKALFVRIPVADLHGFVLLAGESTVKAPGRCIPSAEVHMGTKTPGGIRLGMGKEEVVKLLGRPSTQGDNLLLYRFEILKKFSRESFEQYTAENKDADPKTLYSEVRTDIKIEFVKNRLVLYSVSTTDTF
jgi:predicted CopG family antitoxin